jgi:hypothetical protein
MTVSRWCVAACSCLLASRFQVGPVQVAPPRGPSLFLSGCPSSRFHFWRIRSFESHGPNSVIVSRPVFSSTCVREAGCVVVPCSGPERIASSTTRGKTTVEVHDVLSQTTSSRHCSYPGPPPCGGAWSQRNHHVTRKITNIREGKMTLVSRIPSSLQVW